jgi:hypothetical protein
MCKWLYHIPEYNLLDIFLEIVLLDMIIVYLAFWRTSILLSQGCINSHLYQQYRSIPFSPHPYQHLLLFVLLMIAILTGLRWKFYSFFSSFIVMLEGYIVAFTKVLTIYQIYHTSINCLHHSPLSTNPHSWNSFNRYNFSTYLDTCIHSICTIFTSFTLSPPTGSTCTILLLSDFV